MSNPWSEAVGRAKGRKVSDAERNRAIIEVTNWIVSQRKNRSQSSSTDGLNDAIRRMNPKRPSL